MRGKNLNAAVQVDCCARRRASGDFQSGRTGLRLHVHSRQRIPGVPVASAKKLKLLAEPLAAESRAVQLSARRQMHADQLRRSCHDRGRSDRYSVICLRSGGLHGNRLCQNEDGQNQAKCSSRNARFGHAISIPGLFHDGTLTCLSSAAGARLSTRPRAPVQRPIHRP